MRLTLTGFRATWDWGSFMYTLRFWVRCSAGRTLGELDSAADRRLALRLRLHQAQRPVTLQAPVTDDPVQPVRMVYNPDPDPSYNAAELSDANGRGV